ncbi:uncharacterized protein LOC106779706 isoform X3 [Vigna radiata var. radiata]|uniref:Uncharacterized protein LOC106779706 isoform X3 n=1 Tax=Vigna radiata var. radiata TaxID=3916 RepID=A0A3Q0EKE1_VIGRR|nr:uncharacterized protein LOC106779706 isoform X3 [Vigna radiata var. radiata]
MIEQFNLSVWRKLFIVEGKRFVKMIHQREKTNICLICGGKGDPKCHVYCVQCEAYFQHSLYICRYCLDEFYTEDDGIIIWKCEDCAPRNPKRCGSEELRRSKRVTHVAEAKYRRTKMRKENFAVRKPKSVRSSDGFHTECSRKNDIEKRQPILEDNGIYYEELESPKVPINISTDKQAPEHEKYVYYEALTTLHHNYPEFDKPSRAHPLSDPVWTGQFILNNANNFALVAYASSGACSKVHLAVTELPTLLDVEMLSRCGIWPKSFDMSPPNGDSIGLYFFPHYERDELIFDGVMNQVIEQEFALKAVINNIELLIFSSHVLPPSDRRICDKYYLWGVFKPKSVSGHIRPN